MGRTGKGPGIPNSITGVLVMAVVVLVKRRGENTDHAGENVGQVVDQGPGVSSAG